MDQFWDEMTEDIVDVLGKPVIILLQFWRILCLILNTYLMHRHS